MSDSDGPQPAPGFYPDPAGLYAARYWDGTRWTEQVDGPPTAATGVPGSPFGPAPPLPPQKKTWTDKSAGEKFGTVVIWGLFIGMILAVVAVGTCFAIIAAGSR